MDEDHDNNPDDDLSHSQESAMDAYFHNPILMNAKRVLRLFHVGIPLASLMKTLLPPSAATSAATSTATSTAPSAASDANTPRRPSESSDQRGGSAKSQFKQWLALDTIHDVQAPPSSSLWQHVLVPERPTLMQHYNLTDFTMHAGEALTTFHKLRYDRAQTTYSARNKGHQIIYHDHALWLAFLKLLKDPQLHVMMDGFGDVLHPNTSKQTRAKHAIVYAWFQLWMHHGHSIWFHHQVHVDAATSKALQKQPRVHITLVTGDFQTLDGTNVGRFHANYLRLLKKQVPTAQWSIETSPMAQHPPRHFMALSDVRMPIPPPPPPTKQQLKLRFNQTYKESDIQWLAHTNFLRDAYKAERVLSFKNALFLTGDRLAFLYHRWLHEKYAPKRQIAAFCVFSHATFHYVA